MTTPVSTILVVDDQEANLYVKSRLLRQAGFAVLEARTGSEALQIAFTHKPSLVLLDVNLPDINGLEVCQRIKGDPALASLFVLQISASLISTQDKVRALEGGADSYLLEPVEPEELIATVRSLLRLQHAEQALRESEERLRLAAQVTGFGTYDFNVETGEGYASTELKAIFGLPADTDLNSLFQWVEYIHPADREQVQQTLLASLTRQGKGEFENEYRILCPNGQLRWILVKGKTSFVGEAEQRRARRATGIVLDITNRKQAEEQLKEWNNTLESRVAERTAALERTNQELNQFAYIASHDLNAPLRAIAHLANWISEDADAVLPAASKEHLVKLHGRIKRMEKLISDLLAYSRAGRKRYLPEPVDTAVLVQNVVELLSPPPGFVITIASLLPTLRAERVPLEVVFRNLIDNAIKHHHRPTEGHVYIAAETQGPWVSFSITDNGPGIAPQFHERVFQVFQTLKPREEVEGSGMGLAVVKKLIENREGRIWLESNEGEGTIFHFTWPTIPTANN